MRRLREEPQRPNGGPGLGQRLEQLALVRIHARRPLLLLLLLLRLLLLRGLGVGVLQVLLVLLLLVLLLVVVVVLLLLLLLLLVCWVGGLWARAVKMCKTTSMDR